MRCAAPCLYLYQLDIAKAGRMFASPSAYLPFSIIEPSRTLIAERMA